MIGLFVFIAYLLGGLYFWRRAAYIIANDASFGRKPKAEQIGEGIVIGFFVSLIWPVASFVYICSHRGEGFLKPPAHIARKLRDEQRESRIRELEREVGIR